MVKLLLALMPLDCRFPQPPLQVEPIGMVLAQRANAIEWTQRTGQDWDPDCDPVVTWHSKWLFVKVKMEPVALGGTWVRSTIGNELSTGLLPDADLELTLQEAQSASAQAVGANPMNKRIYTIAGFFIIVAMALLAPLIIEKNPRINHEGQAIPRNALHDNSTEPNLKLILLLEENIPHQGESSGDN